MRSSIKNRYRIAELDVPSRNLRINDWANSVRVDVANVVPMKEDSALYLQDKLVYPTIWGTKKFDDFIFFNLKQQKLLESMEDLLEQQYLQINKEHIQLKKIKNEQNRSKIPLALSAGILSTLIGSAMIMLPYPFNLITSIAMGGPLSVSILALRR